MHAITEQELSNNRTKDIQQTLLTEMSVAAQLLRYSPQFTELMVYYSVQQNTLCIPLPILWQHNTLLTNYSIKKHWIVGHPNIREKLPIRNYVIRGPV
jgi:hypothetical protein